MKRESSTAAWRQYEAGRAYKRRCGLYERIRENERFWRGDQWYGDAADLPRPVFNVIRRVVEHLICSILSGPVSVRYSDDNLPAADNRAAAEGLRQGLDALNRNAAYRWEQCRMDRLLRHVLNDAAVTGDGVFYAYWDADRETGGNWRGDIVTDCVDSVNLFVADVNRADIQSQAYVMLSGRARVEDLRAEAISAGLPAEEAVKRILPDEETGTQAGDMAMLELEGEDAAKATYLI
ncbi:MAG: hypothetical protein IJC15_08800, partial [Clostridia bacterium]|nr:hypothetical protein [Clostridia bacterium]